MYQERDSFLGLGEDLLYLRRILNSILTTKPDILLVGLFHGSEEFVFDELSSINFDLFYRGNKILFLETILYTGYSLGFNELSNEAFYTVENWDFFGRCLNENFIKKNWLIHGLETIEMHPENIKRLLALHPLKERSSTGKFVTQNRSCATAFSGPYSLNTDMYRYYTENEEDFNYRYRFSEVNKKWLEIINFQMAYSQQQQQAIKDNIILIICGADHVISDYQQNQTEEINQHSMFNLLRKTYPQSKIAFLCRRRHTAKNSDTPYKKYIFGNNFGANIRL
jgi:hypothetical protein